MKKKPVTKAEFDHLVHDAELRGIEADRTRGAFSPCWQALFVNDVYVRYRIKNAAVSH